MEQQMVGSSSSKDNITTVEVVQDENSTSPMVDEGRYDDLGNYIQNIETLPDVFSKLTKFNSEKKLSAYAIIFVFKNIEKPTRDDVYHALKTMKCHPSNVKGIIKRGSKGFTIEFYDQTWKKAIISLVSQHYSDEFNAFPCVAEEKRITVGGIPSHLSNEDILDFLSIFGEFHTEPNKIINRLDEFGVEKGERVFLCKKLNIDILSSYPVYGHTLSFRYPGQPHTCILCYQRSHTANECTVVPNNKFLKPISAFQDDNLPDVETESNTNHQPATTSARSSVGIGSGSYSYAERTRVNLRPGGGRSGQMRKTWGDGGHSYPDGGKPRYVTKPPVSTQATLGDFLGAVTFSKQNRKIRKVSVVEKSQQEQMNDKVIIDANSKIMKVQRILGDARFSDKSEKDVAKEVHQTMEDLRNVLPPADDEWNPIVDGSPENIKRLFEYDIQLLTNCSEKMGVSANRLQSKTFRGMLNNYIDCLENSRKRPLSTSSG